MRIPLMIIQPDRAVQITGRFRGITKRVSDAFPGLRINLIGIGAGVEADEYVAASILSTLLYGMLLSSLVFTLLFILGAYMEQTVILSLIAGLIITVLLFTVFLLYPGILAGKKAEEIEKDLVFALKDMLLEVNSGATIYGAMVEVAKSGYGRVSEEFDRVVRQVNVGASVEDALEDLALKTTSEHFRNSIWQLVNALKSGSDMENAIKELIKNLTTEQRMKIRNYAQELNIMVLLYMLFAVVIPTIVTTLVIVVGPFMGLALGPEAFYIILPTSLFIQIALVEFIKSRRPVVQL